MTRPVVLSHCLADEACRYDGEALRDAVVSQLKPFVTYLFEQVLFEPYPEALMSLRDSGKGREP